MSLNPKKVKSVWTIAWDDTQATFVLVDELGDVAKLSKSRAELADYAFENGADEVKHDYDLVAHK